MSSLYFPLASLLVSLLLITIFYNKERQKNIDTKIYSRMIIINLFETITAILIIILAKTAGTNALLYFFDRVDFILIMLWCSNLFIYVYYVSFEKDNFVLNFIMNITKVVYSLSLLITSFEIINYEDIIDTAGTAPFLVSVYCGVFAILMLYCLIVVVLSKNKKLKIEKYYPLFVFIVLILISLVLRKFWPTMVLEPFMISFINLIMFFTIENPDLKMIEQLSLAKEQAEKYGNEKTLFLFNMSQNIRRPLNNIENISECLQSTEDINIIKDNVNLLKSSVQQIKYVVNNSLDISTIEAKNLKVMDEKYDLRKIVEMIKLKVNSQIKNKNLVFNVTISETLPSVFYGDSIRIKQILNTLVLNSVKHTEEGFIDLNINCIIKYDVCRLIINVEDSGCGIKAKDIDKIFDKHDVEECLTDNNTLRLDTLKKMINYIGGTIMVESEPKKGTRFTVTIDQKIELTNDINEIDINRKKILIVVTEDDVLKKQIDKYFKKEKYELLYCKNGEEALNNLRNGQKVDIVLIDKELNKLNYLETFNRMKEIPNFNAPTFIIGNEINDEETMNLKAKGFKDVIVKPLTIKKISVIE